MGNELFEEKNVGLSGVANKFSSFGYVGGNKMYPVFVDEAKKIYVVAKSPKDFLHCVKRMDMNCVHEEMKDMFDFKVKYEKLCEAFGYDKRFAKDYLQKSVDHIFSRYQAESKNCKSVER